MEPKAGPVLSKEQRLTLHQLRLLEWLEEQAGRAMEEPEAEEGETAELPTALPERWDLTQGVTLYDWQADCLQRWFDAGGRGTAKVVTGGGKTLLALAIAQQLQNAVQPELRMAVVVPTVVLMQQWYDELLERGNLPARAIGRLGGGYKDGFGGDVRVLVAVLASACKLLPKRVKQARVGDRLLLVVDECHRAGATEMAHVLSTPRTWSLGLSATPERDEDEEGGAATGGYDESTLGRELGPLIYDFDLRQALALGVIPQFTIHHHGLALAPDEQAQYERASRTISDAREELKALAPAKASGGGAFFAWIKKVIAKGGELAAIGIRFQSEASRRSRLLQRSKSRAEAAKAILQKEFAANPDARAILFHESIDAVMALFVDLQQSGFPVVAEHSRLPDSARETSLDLYRRGVAQVVVSARSLIEGFNVPATDVGIIVASSKSVRQRVQSLGRVLRRHRGRDGEEKTSHIHVLYMRGTVDEFLYEKADWDRTTGVDNNRYFQWSPPVEPIEMGSPPRRPAPRDDELDETELAPGDRYPGRYEGAEFSCDSKGNLSDIDGNAMGSVRGLTRRIREVKGSYGRFRVSPRRQNVLVRARTSEGWETYFVSRLDEPLHSPLVEEGLDSDALRAWAQSAEPGATYPPTQLAATQAPWRYRAKRGGILSRRVRGGEEYARDERRAVDAAKGRDCRKLLAAIAEAGRRGFHISQLELNELDHVLFREHGQLRFLAALEHGLEFPSEVKDR